jgi:hypothetical protein
MSSRHLRASQTGCLSPRKTPILVAEAQLLQTAIHSREKNFWIDWFAQNSLRSGGLRPLLDARYRRDHDHRDTGETCVLTSSERNPQPSSTGMTKSRMIALGNIGRVQAIECVATIRSRATGITVRLSSPRRTDRTPGSSSTTSNIVVPRSCSKIWAIEGNFAKLRNGLKGYAKQRSSNPQRNLYRLNSALIKSFH